MYAFSLLRTTSVCTSLFTRNFIYLVQFSALGRSLCYGQRRQVHLSETSTEERAASNHVKLNASFFSHGKTVYFCGNTFGNIIMYDALFTGHAMRNNRQMMTTMKMTWETVHQPQKTSNLKHQRQQHRHKQRQIVDRKNC